MPGASGAEEGLEGGGCADVEADIFNGRHFSHWNETKHDYIQLGNGKVAGL